MNHEIQNMDAEIESSLEQIADVKGMSLDDVKDLYEEKKEQLRDRLEDDVGEDELPKIAKKATHAAINSNTRVTGETEELPTLVIGHSGERPNVGNGDRGLIAFGIVNPQQGGVIKNPPKEDPPGLAVFVFNEGLGADLGDIRQKFQPFNTVKVWASRRQAGTVSKKGRDGAVEIDGEKSKPPVYQCETTDETHVEDADLDGLPSERSEIRELINSNYITGEDEFDLADHSDYLSAMDSQYSADWGVDLKRIEGTVVDVVKDVENDWAQYTIADDSVIDIKDLESTDLELGQQGSTLGLKVWMPPDLVQYGIDSIVEVYGTLTRNQNGNIEMQGAAVVPIAAFDIDEEAAKPGGGNSSNDSGDDSSEQVKKRSI